ncbi:hypothetical protein BE21_09480 [Sorangium cellulosum]|uniref:Uncharacterized protein n=1 Tax=Sorangium cellulosum TaxID=56 RepID=A0A150U1U6_SORCE|nr:hypothetical protein BE21_09480 [Sorangium cellulosum]
MDKMTLTGPQQSVYEFVAKHGAVEMAQLKSRGLDVRAANNLVKSGVLTLTNNVYRIKARKKAAKEDEAPTSAPAEAAPISQPQEVVPASEQAPEAANDTVETPESPAAGSEAQAGGQAPETAVEASEKAAEEVGEASEAQVEQPAAGKKASKKTKAPKAPRAKKTVTNATGRCLCGCGAELGPKRRFAQGHDAKLHSIVLKVARGQAGRGALPEACVDKFSPTMTYLNGAPWMTDEIREAIGL